MSVLSYTFADLKSAAGHAAAKNSASGTPAFDSGNPAAQVVNAALDALARAHPWHWRIKYDTLSVTSGDTSIALPDDFSELIWVQGLASPYAAKRFRPSDHWELTVARQQATAVAANAVAATGVFFAVAAAAQASVTALRTYRLEIHPAAPSTASDCLQLVYRGMPPKLSADTDVADVPTDCQDLLLQGVRAMAAAREGAASAGAELALYDRMLAQQKELNDRVPCPEMARVKALVDDYWAIGGIRGTWS